MNPSPWHTMTRRDDPLREEEVVEVFLDPAGSGSSYYELEISPANIVCDLRIARPWPELQGDRAWHCAGLETVVRHSSAEPGGQPGWTATACLPWDGLAALSDEAAVRVPPRSGDRWRFNVVRIKRPNGPALKPAYAQAHNNYPYLLMTSGKLEEAAQHYRAAIESQPDFRAAHFNLGRILVNQGRVVEAIEHLRQTLTPEDEETPRCTYALGAAYARLGNRALALKHMQEAQEKATARGQTELVNSIEKDLRRLTGTTSPP